MFGVKRSLAKEVHKDLSGPQEGLGLGRSCKETR